MMKPSDISAPTPPRPEWTESAFTREVSIIDGHVAAMSARLQEHVKQRLEAECDEIAAAAGWTGAESPALLLAPGEVQIHAQQLAQCLVSNWVSAIKLSHRQARRGGQKAITLDDSWLPADGSAGQIMEGLRNFTADPDFVMRKFHEYLAEHASDPAPFAVSARLRLVTVGGRRQVESAPSP